MAINKSSNAPSKHLQRFYYSQDEIIEKPFNWKQMLRLFTYMKPYSKSLLPKAIIAVLISTIIRLIIPLFTGVLAIDYAIGGGNYSALMWIVAAVAVLYIIAYFANVLRMRWMNRLGQHVIYDLRHHLFSHVERLSHNFFDKRSAGSILVRILNDVNSLQDLFTNGVINLMMDFIMLLGIVIILFSLSPEFAIAVVIILPIMFFVSTKLRRNIRRAWQGVRLKQSKLNSHLNESIQGIRVTQAYTQEKQNMEFFEGVNTETYGAWQNATQKNAFFRPVVEMSNAVGTVILIVYGTYLYSTGSISTGDLVSFAFFLGMFWEPISRLGQVYNQLLVGMASSERIFEFLDEKPNVPENEHAVAIDMKGRIDFENVEFAYDEKRKALDNISIHATPGETLALVGHTGSGKTTIASLISRFYDATAGSVKIDGIDVKDIELQSLRTQISIVLQDTFIFSGTIMENIRFGNPNASDDEVIDAAKKIGADGFISRMADGYHTEVEERGNILSAGERQLLSFARALLANPRIIILDEATASIDTETEMRIQEALKTLLKGRTAIIIAHRLSTIREADQIIVLDHGHLMERGNHDALMTHRGIYFNLVRSQFQASEA
ncbi:ABC transporter ATP-binding protein [Aureibacillus halotolerans]|uniref:Putative ABC transport system ATP-binding protein/ATP-binding cassette subfamily B protein n=1 Tax=Aureibacillus halotolerans TaxID=1508390 RepID=A0A4R6U918_9BACI|nr:ABC transporter ATP-binding protein [Aureibacillus halotolerans]TDQ42252.1 putative ABC transport system ATP-binding protein/ATP-binding cassette subfamily B protein [Aureibacillus halotolerans]